MVSRKVKLVGLEGTGKRVYLALEVDDEPKTYEVKITDKAGVFGVVFPDDLGLLLRGVPEVSKNIVSSVKEKYRGQLSIRRRAA